MEKIRFKDLSGSLKTLVVFGWILFGAYTFVFLTAFMVGFFTTLI